MIDYYESGKFAKDVRDAIDAADVYLTKRIQENNQLQNPHRLAIVLDIDDTSISNYPKYKTGDFAHLHDIIEKGFHDVHAPAITPTLELYNKAIRNGVHAFFITGRPEDVKSYTITNLNNAGYYGWSDLILINKNDTKQSAEVFKTAIREKLSKAGYDIILNMGDQESDFSGGFAERIVKIPTHYIL